MKQSEITDRIKEGLKKGYRENLLLLSSYNDFVDQVREYLLTVNVAQQLLDWNSHHSYKINIEYPVFSFYNNAFLAYYWDITDIFNMSIIPREEGHSPTDKRYQKIDLAITQEQSGDNASTHERTMVGIELKGINKKEAEIIQDAERMAKAMILKDKSSENSIKFCFCGFLRRFDTTEKMVTIAYIKQKTETETKRWETICKNLNNQFTDLIFSIEMFEIINTPLEAVHEMHTEMESDYSEVANSTGTVVGGILIINRR